MSRYSEAEINSRMMSFPMCDNYADDDKEEHSRVWYAWRDYLCNAVKAKTGRTTKLRDGWDNPASNGLLDDELSYHLSGGMTQRWPAEIAPSSNWTIKTRVEEEAPKPALATSTTSSAPSRQLKRKVSSSCASSPPKRSYTTDTTSLQVVTNEAAQSTPAPTQAPTIMRRNSGLAADGPTALFLQSMAGQAVRITESMEEAIDDAHNTEMTVQEAAEHIAAADAIREQLVVTFIEDGLLPQRHADDLADAEKSLIEDSGIGEAVSNMFGTVGALISSYEHVAFHTRTESVEKARPTRPAVANSDELPSAEKKNLEGEEAVAVGLRPSALGKMLKGDKLLGIETWIKRVAGGCEPEFDTYDWGMGESILDDDEGSEGEGIDAASSSEVADSDTTENTSPSVSGWTPRKVQQSITETITVTQGRRQGIS